jgi:hypothetical protein
MTKKSKQSKKSTKNSKRTKVAAQPEDDTDTAIQSEVAEVPQTTPAIPEAEVSVDSREAVAASAQVTPAAPATPSSSATRSDAARANIKEGLRLHQIAGRPTKEQLILVFGTKGYAMPWAQRTERFGITPETFQAALAKGVPAIRLGPGAQTVVEKTNETT